MMLISHVLTCIKYSLFTNLPLVTVYKLTIQKLLFLKYLTSLFVKIPSLSNFIFCRG